MGFIQLFIIFRLFVVGKNYLLAKNKENATVIGTIFEIIAITTLVLVLEYFFPFLT